MEDCDYTIYNRCPDCDGDLELRLAQAGGGACWQYCTRPGCNWRGSDYDATQLVQSLHHREQSLLKYLKARHYQELSGARAFLEGEGWQWHRTPTDWGEWSHPALPKIWKHFDRCNTESAITITANYLLRGKWEA